MHAQRDDQRTIQGVYDRWFQAMEVGDVEKALRLVTDDVVWKSPGDAAAVGKDALQTRLEAFHAHVRETVSFQIEEIEVAGDWAYVRVTERATVSPISGGPTATLTGMHLSILHRDDERGWRIARDVSSLDGEP